MWHMKCIYQNCKLPENNKRYGVQAAYLFLSLTYLLKDTAQFNFFSLALFVMPVLMDLYFGSLEGGILSLIRICFIILNTVLILICVLGFFSVIVEIEDSFVVTSTAVIFANYSIPKCYIAWLLPIELLIPLIYWKGAPNQQTMSIERGISKIRKERKSAVK